MSRREEANCFAFVKDEKGFSLRVKRARKAPTPVGREIPSRRTRFYLTSSKLIAIISLTNW